MKTSKFTVEQIAHALKRVESGITVAQVCREPGGAEAGDEEDSDSSGRRS